MSEWLTTGEMIDRLKVGEVAEGVDSLGKEYCVTKTEYGMSFCSSTGDTRGYLEFTLNKNILGARWRILYRFVSFEEAMKALKEGKSVAFHAENANRPITFDESYPLTGFYDDHDLFIDFSDLLEGKWTIEE
ncbi:hypothetical protein QT236_14485 [Geobacillus stearothermophilus]|nr:hypothetical protein QT236_12645 [Geobacillus stearothermophilus]WJQ03226.1 hypothetical protein QT236_14485 [Geobacillus stearothermophilus]